MPSIFTHSQAIKNRKMACLQALTAIPCQEDVTRAKASIP
jgi:hypothetical protein